MKKVEDTSRYGIERGSQENAKGCRQVAWRGKSVVPLCGRNQVKQADELLVDYVFIIERKVLYDAEDGGVCKDACVKQMDGIVG